MLKLKEEETKTEEPKTDEIPSGWYAIDDIPSDYKVYPKGTRILSRPLNVLEVKHLATMTDKTTDAVINGVLKDSVKGIDYRDLVMADKYYIIMWQRYRTYVGDKFGIKYTCPECGEEGKFDFDISQINFEGGLPEDYSLEKEYDIGGHKVQLEQPRVKFVEMVKMWLLEHSDADPEILGNIAYRIWKLDGREIDLDEAYDFCIKLPPADFVKLNGICAKTEITLDPTVEVKCEHCERQVPIGVSFRPSFFLPEYTDW